MYQRKRQDLLATLHASLSPLFLGQLKNLHKTVTATFSKEITAGLKEHGYDFAEVVEKGKAKAKDTFVKGARGKSTLLLKGKTLYVVYGETTDKDQRSRLKRPTGSTRMNLDCWRRV